MSDRPSSRLLAFPGVSREWAFAGTAWRPFSPSPSPRAATATPIGPVRHNGGGYPGFYSAALGLYGEVGPAFLGVIEGVAETTSSLLKLYSGVLADRVRNRKGLVLAGYALSALARPLAAVAIPSASDTRSSTSVGSGSDSKTAFTWTAPTGRASSTSKAPTAGSINGNRRCG